jgi:phosphate-selective porin OprO/OprP
MPDWRFSATKRNSIPFHRQLILVKLSPPPADLLRMKKLKRHLPLLLLAFGLAFSNPALSGPKQMMMLMEMLKQNGSLTEAQFQQLKAAMEAEEPPATPSSSPAPASPPMTAEPAPSETREVRLSTRGGSIKAEAYDGESSLELTAQIAADAAFYSSDQSDLGDGAEIRYARIGLEGSLYGAWEYELEADFAGEDIGLKDAWLGYRSLGHSLIRAGLFKQPFSLEEATPSAYQTFMERSLINELAPGKNIGVGMESHDTHWYLAGGIFGEGPNDADDKLDDEGWGGSLRGVWAPLPEKGRVIHLGASADYRNFGGDSDTEANWRIRTHPESHIVDKTNYLLDTGKIKHIDHSRSLALEAAAVYGPFSLQGEYLRTRINIEDHAEPLNFHGYYIAGSWFITGESRNYDIKQARFERITPRSNFSWGEGRGAWELALRHSYLDLDDQDIQGGRQSNTTFGLNWYINPHTRFMANYILVDTDPYASGLNNNPKIFQLRGQYDF